MDTKRTSLRIFATIAVGLAVGLLLIRLPDASAGFFGNLWKNITAPFAPAVGQPSPPIIPPAEIKAATALYKPVIDYERAVVSAIKKASPAVVSITVSKNVPILENCRRSPFFDIPPEFREFFGDDAFPDFSGRCDTGRSKLQEIGGGSGFIISADGLILTNKHVVAEKGASYTVFTNDGKKYDAKVLARDPLQDLAIMKISANGLPTVELGNSDSVELGQTAIAIGNALGEFRNTASVGIISGLSRTVTAGGPGVGLETIRGVLQTDAAINPGNSGGPLLNLRGEVIGINTAIAAGAQNVGFAIPINHARRDIETVRRGKEIEAPFLGVRYLIITPDTAEKQKLPVEYGALVRGAEDGPAVMPDSPAAKAGVQAEDIILEINGIKIDQDHPLAGLIAMRSVGDRVVLKIRRGSQEFTVNAVLAKRPGE